MFLGIDIGTSSVKAVLMDEDGVVVDRCSAPLSISRPRPGWSEQDPDDWWKATQIAVTSLGARERSAVRAVGLSGQMHGATLLDATDRPLRPAILWNDGRSQAECDELEAIEPACRRITGNIPMAGFTAPKLLWVRKHEPAVFAATRSVLLPKDYVRLRMTAAKASDVSDASGTLWLDVARRAWSPEMLDATHLSEQHMPTLHEGPDITGQLRAEVAESWGMKRVPVAAGGGDNAAGAVGAGIIGPGDALLSLGSSGVLFVAGDVFLPHSERAVHAFCHALPGRWHQMSVMLSATSCIDWAASLSGCKDTAEFLARVEARGRLDGSEIFLPYLSGERTPHNDPCARGVLFGLDHDSDSMAVGQAVLEGVAFGLADGLDALLEAGARVDQLSVIGGGARSHWWARVLAAALARPLIYRDGSEVGAALGAARLARIGITGEPEAEVCKAPPVRALVEPKSCDIECMAEKRAQFTRLYPTLCKSFRGD